MTIRTVTDVRPDKIASGLPSGAARTIKRLALPIESANETPATPAIRTLSHATVATSMQVAESARPLVTLLIRGFRVRAPGAPTATTYPDGLVRGTDRGTIGRFSPASSR